MRLKSYTAPSMAEAMRLVRKELGEDAIIVASQNERESGQVRVTAAVDSPDDLETLVAVDAREPQDLGSIILALNGHGAPARVMDKLVDAAWESGTADPLMALAAALDAHYRFVPLRCGGEARPVMLVGPNGSGKTVTVAKIAARAALDGQPVEILTTDTVRAGAIAQLSAFTEILGLNLQVCESGAALADVIGACPPGTTVVIDSPGTNPFDSAAMSELASLAAAAGAEPVLVIAAGGDSLEAADTAEAFSAIGAARVIGTRLDAARRYGGLLAAAEACMTFCEVSLRPQIADGLSPLTPVSLARLLLRRAATFISNGSSVEDLS